MNAMRICSSVPRRPLVAPRGLRGRSRAVVASLLVVLVASGCGSTEGKGTEAPARTSPATAEKVTMPAVPGVDVAGLPAAEQQRWAKLLGTLLSPCGDPVSLAKCATDEGRGCRACRPAARYVARLVAGGIDDGTVEQLYRLRYGPDTKVDVDVSRAPVRGSPMAPVLLVEFSDFQCPFCAAARPLLERIVRESGGKVRLAYKHFPLPSHTHAKLAAQAAVAAQLQGRFWEMHDLLFTHQDRLERADLLGYAKQLGLDVARFERDMDSDAVQRRVEADREEGRKLGVDGTPYLFVDGRRYMEDLEDLDAYLQECLDAM